MSEAQKPPLWKQLLGAIAGAGVALMLYEAYVIVTPQLTALITLPTSQAPSTFDEVGTIVGPQPLWPTGTLGSPAVASSSSSVSSSSAIAQSSQSSQSSENRIFYGPFGTIQRLKRYFLPISEDTSSSASSQVAAMPQSSIASSSSLSSTIQAYGRGTWPTATAEAPMVKIDRDMDASSSSIRTITRGRGRSPTINWDSPIANIPPSMPMESASSSSEVSSEFVEIADPAPVAEEQPQEEPIVVAEPEPLLPPPEEQPEVLPVMSHSESLPNSGLGLDLLAVAAVGAVVGRRRVSRRVQK